jgi:hypothetical protein
LVADAYPQAQDVAAEQSAFVPARFRAISLFGTLLWFIIRDFIRSPWLVVDIVAIVGLQLFLPSTNPAREGYFGLLYWFMLALAAVNTMAIFSRAGSTHTYAILARPVTRTTYVAAGMIAAWLLSILAYLLVTALAYLRFGPLFQSPGADLFGFPGYLSASIPMILAAGFAVSLASLLSAFVSPFWVRFVVLAVIAVLIMSFDPRNFPIPFMQGIVEHIPPVLAPIAGAVRLATDSSPDLLARVSVVVLAAYTCTLLALVLWLSTRRELVLD